MSGKQKLPKRRTTPELERTPRVRSVSAMGDKAILWRLGEMAWDGLWSWNDRNSALWAKIYAKMGQIETMSWVEAQQNHRSPLKPVDVGSLCRDAQVELVRINHDDFDPLWEIHVDGVTRVWGLKVDDAFYVLWCDPKHEVCTSSLNTTATDKT